MTITKLRSNPDFKKYLLASVLFIILTIWWVIVVTQFNQDRFLLLFSSTYGVMSLVGGIYGMNIAKKWGFKSLIGKSLLMFSLGLFAQYFGQLVYSYYGLFRNIEVPYPSIGDIGYFGSVLFYIYSNLLLAKAAGLKIKFDSFLKTTHSILIPGTILIIAYILFLAGYHFDLSNPIKIFLDFAYPLGQAIYLSIAILTYTFSKGKLGGIMKNKILFVLGVLFFQFLCDYTFLYQSSRGLWHVGGFNDFMYLTSYFLMTLALLQLSNKSIKQLVLPNIKNKNRSIPLQTEDVFAKLAVKIITEEEKVIGTVAWDLAFGVDGLLVDTDYTLRLVGNKNKIINDLVAQYEKVFGQSSRELAKDAFKTLSTIVDALVIEATVTLNLTNAWFFVRQTSTENFKSIYPLGEPKLSITREQPLITYLTNQKTLIVRSAIPHLLSEAKTIAEAKDLNSINQELERCGAQIAGGVFSDHELIGILMLGSKMNTEDFSQQDFIFVTQLLQSSARNLAQVIHYRDTQVSILQNVRT